MTKTTGRLKATWPEALTRLPPGFKKAHAMAKAAQDWELKTMALAQTIGAEQARKLVEDAESLSVSTCMSRGQALDMLVQATTAAIPEPIEDRIARLRALNEHAADMNARNAKEVGVELDPGHTGNSPSALRKRAMAESASWERMHGAKRRPFRMTLDPTGEVITQGGEW